MKGKGGRIRTVPVPAGVKARIDLWLEAAGITTGPVLRSIDRHGNLGGSLSGQGGLDLVAAYAAVSCTGRPSGGWGRRRRPSEPLASRNRHASTASPVDVAHEASRRKSLGFPNETAPETKDCHPRTAASTIADRAETSIPTNESQCALARV
jgi:hypothetical protein